MAARSRSRPHARRTASRAAEGPPPTEVIVGLAATARRLGAGVGRLALLPGRVAVRLPFAQAVFDGRRRALQDSLAGTVVVHVSASGEST